MYFIRFLLALLLTIAVEGAAILLIFRRKKYAYYSLLCNLLTNPAMNALLLISSWLLGMRVYYPALAVAEITVVIVEAIVYNYICGFGMKKAAALSVFLNALSFAAGILINPARFF